MTTRTPVEFIEIPIVTAWGTFRANGTAVALTRLQFPDGLKRSRGTPTSSPVHRAKKSDPVWLAPLAAYLSAFVAGEPSHALAARVPVDLAGIGPFHTTVLETLRRVKPGETVSYGELAKRAGSPAAARAVGAAMAANPIPLVIPCHRVLAASMRIGGFSAPGGALTKRWVLEHEGAASGLFKVAAHA
jgi:methylated-DNA-[protein]-cysteine S-methyltransferase